MKRLVNIKDMYKSFFGVVALDGMDFSLDEGEVRCLVGENGCGKSTMIKIISGYYTYDEGTLEINEKEYKRITPAESIAEGIQVIYQDFSLFDNMTVAENILMYSTVADRKLLISNRKIRQKAVETLNRINVDIDPDAYVSTLSVSQKQLVAICRALAQDCRLLVMDEPTTALTTHEVEKLFEIVKELKRQNVAVIFVSHKLEEVLEICDSITIMRGGKNVYDGRTADRVLSKEEIIYYMTGKQFSDKSYEFESTGERPLLEVKDYTLAGAFQGISFTVEKGEILGITGILGCGRSELAESLFGVLPADSGSVTLDGEEMGIIRSIPEAIEHDIAYVPDDRLTKGLHLEQSIADNAIIRVLGDYAGRLGSLDRKGLQERKESSLSTMTVAGLVPENPVKSLSGGNQQKICLIKWLSSEPKLLILNCPTVGVDVGAKSDIHDIIRNLAREHGTGVVVISDDIYEIMQLCNRVLVMKEGRIAFEKNTRDTTMEYLESALAEVKTE